MVQMMYVCSAGRNAQDRKTREVDKESSVLRRVLNGPCTGGHGGQVISKEGPIGPKARFESWEFSKRKGPPKISHAPLTVYRPVLMIGSVMR